MAWPRSARRSAAAWATIGFPGPLANTTVRNQSAPAPALSPCAQRDPVVQRVGHYGSGRPWVGAPITVHLLRCYAVARLLEVFSLCPAAVAELRALPAFADEAVSALFLGVLARRLLWRRFRGRRATSCQRPRHLLGAVFPEGPRGAGVLLRRGAPPPGSRVLSFDRCRI